MKSFESFRLDILILFLPFENSFLELAIKHFLSLSIHAYLFDSSTISIVSQNEFWTTKSHYFPYSYKIHFYKKTLISRGTKYEYYH